ncbi:MAG: twin-arginine translocase TatA/TatE family subunit [Balneolaceae bacterium]|nr:twin-arginine translocase TatA/TatE family subunit [Balneolaceae bacterium]
MSFGGTEIFIIFAVVILFFGAKKIPELARGIGQGIVEFKKTTKDSEEITEQQSADEKSP